MQANDSIKLPGKYFAGVPTNTNGGNGMTFIQIIPCTTQNH
jgi:hypothetical protein